jgi:hypothetical protein
MTFIKVGNKCLIITLLPCKCMNIWDVYMNVCVCVYTYVCENDLWQCLDKNILSNGYCVLGGVTKIGSLTG